MLEQNPPTDLDVQAAFLNTDGIAAEIRGGLFLMLLVLVAYLIVQVYKGDMRGAMQRLAVVGVAIITVGLGAAFLLNPDDSGKVTEQIVNVEPEPTRTR